MSGCFDTPKGLEHPAPADKLPHLSHAFNTPFLKIESLNSKSLAVSLKVSVRDIHSPVQNSLIVNR